VVRGDGVRQALGIGLERERGGAEEKQECDTAHGVVPFFRFDQF